MAVPTPPDIDELSAHVLAQNYDTGSFQRGTAYAGQSRTRVLSHEPGALSGIVAGTARTPYLVDVQWWRDRDRIAVHDNCSCPLGGSCKHAVSLIITARREAEQTTTADWRRSLAGVVDAASQTDVDTVAMALQVAVNRPKRTSYAPAPQLQVTVRPLRMGRKGKWVKTGASWRDIDYSYGWNTHSVSTTHRSLLRSMLAGSADARYSAPSNGALALDSFGSQVWDQLRSARDAGIELVRERSGERVVISDAPAQASFDLTADAAGDIALEVVFHRDGEPIHLDPERAATIGEPAHGLFLLSGDTLELIPLDRPMAPQLARMLTSPPVAIPADATDELLDHYEPLLSQVAPVRSSDGSVQITSSQFEGLVALVEHDEVDQATLRWAARYRRADRVTDHLLSGPGRGRDRDAERAAADRLELPTQLMDQLVDERGRPVSFAAEGPDAITLLTEVVPWLIERDQVLVEVSGAAPPLREATADPLIELSVTASADEGARNDWFDLAVHVSVDGESIGFAELFSALSMDEQVLMMDSGTWLRLDRPEFAQLRRLISEARGLADHEHDHDDVTVRINRFQSSWWSELTALGVVARQSAEWERAVEGLRTLESPSTVTAPAGLDAALRPYQQEGLDWLAYLHRHELGGVLADDMGLGKTVQALALFLHVLESKPDARFLVVAPTSVVENWRREARQFAPGLEVRTISETARRRGPRIVEAVGDAQILVTSYSLFRLECDQYEEVDWEVLVLDEAQFVKNHKSKTYQCVRRLDAAMKLGITGTPLENSLMDLWSLLSITAPGLYPDPDRFAKVYQRPIENGSAPELLTTLRRRIAPLMRRRTKDQVLDDLPPKTELTVEVEMSPRHARIYQTQLQRQRQKVLGLVGDVNKHRFEILKSLTMLRQLALDPALVDPKHDKVGSAKLDRLVEDLSEVVAEGHRALVFSQFTRYLARVRTRLDAARIEHSYLDGRTRKRDEAIESFKNGTNPVFVISLKAGGFGLNLTEADYCFVLDPWWNPAVETQAVDRTHRIGQRSAVMVYRYVSTDTIEEKVMELKERKAALFSSIVDADGALSGALDADDFRALLDL